MRFTVAPPCRPPAAASALLWPAASSLSDACCLIFCAASTSLALAAAAMAAELATSAPQPARLSKRTTKISRRIAELPSTSGSVLAVRISGQTSACGTAFATPSRTFWASRLPLASQQLRKRSGRGECSRRGGAPTGMGARAGRAERGRSRTPWKLTDGKGSQIPFPSLTENETPAAVSLHFRMGTLDPPRCKPQARRGCKPHPALLDPVLPSDRATER